MLILFIVFPLFNMLIWFLVGAPPGADQRQGEAERVTAAAQRVKWAGVVGEGS